MNKLTPPFAAEHCAVTDQGGPEGATRTLAAAIDPAVAQLFADLLNTEARDHDLAAACAGLLREGMSPAEEAAARRYAIDELRRFENSK
jgi:hypothetical protein